MPAALTYPGVYVEEIPSGVRTITGVATSVTAFIGRARRGPVDKAITINSFADFERIFGALWVESSLGYAVRDFYLNGGSQAVIVRLYHAETKDNKPTKDRANITLDDLTLEAIDQGDWGKYLRVILDVDVSEDVAKRMGVKKEDLFNVTLRDVGPGGVVERFNNVSIVKSPRRIDKVLADESKLMRWSGDYPSEDKLPKIDKVKAAHDAAKELVAKQSAKPPKPEDIKAAADTLAKALAELQDPISKAEHALALLKKTPDSKPEDIKKAQEKVEEARSNLDETVSDGKDLTKADDFTPPGAEAEKKGLYALEQLFARDGLFNILCIPPYKDLNSNVETSLIADAAAYCEKRRAMLLVDPPASWNEKAKAKDGFTDPNDQVGTRSRNAALFFPRFNQPNPLRDNQVEEFVPCGAVAGIFARTDTQRGVWKAPAGLDAALVGVPQLSVPLTDEENGELNPLGINCLRAFPAAGRVVWGSRTLRGADQLADEWKYIPVRRTALYIEESLFRGLKWVVFEPNDEPLWAQIRLNVGAFMHNLFTQGAFQGTTSRDAYFVKCDKETTTQNDINLGVVNIVVGFAPLKPAEFVVIKLQQMAGQIET